jgi:hypothetical protein
VPQFPFVVLCLLQLRLLLKSVLIVGGLLDGTMVGYVISLMWFADQSLVEVLHAVNTWLQYSPYEPYLYYLKGE